MKRVVNNNDPRIVLVVNDAYVNGDFLECDAGWDSFSLWADEWKLEDYPGVVVEIESAESYRSGREFRVTTFCSAELMASMVESEDARLTVWEQLKGALVEELRRFSKGRGAQISSRPSTNNHSPDFALARSDFGGQNRQEK